MRQISIYESFSDSQRPSVTHQSIAVSYYDSDIYASSHLLPEYAVKTSLRRGLRPQYTAFLIEHGAVTPNNVVTISEVKRF